MLCGCLESPFESSSQHNANNGSLTTSFPGQRRFVKTGGNALAAYDPSKHGDGSHHGSNGNGGGGGMIGNARVSVTVPAGVSPGQTIQVAAPDGRMISASVPPGMNPGSTFIVEFPPANQSQQGTAVPEGRNPSVASGSNAIAADDVHAAPQGSYHGVQVIPPPSQMSQLSQVPAASPASLPVPVPPPQTYPPAPSSVACKQKQKMVLVKVPPGTAPGTTLHVQIPGEKRMIAAQVPPGVSEFRVSYEARPDDAGFAPLPVPLPPPQSAAPSPMPPASNQQQKLILVKVPPGTAPGTTLHVQIPGENRMIAAQVPPGVSEFHVACPPSGVPQQQQQQQPGSHGWNNNNNGRNSNSGNGNNRFGSGMSSVIPMVAGGALMGAAGMAMYDHAAHTSSNNGYADNNTAYADSDCNAGAENYADDSNAYAGNNNDGGGYGMGNYDDGGGGFDGGDFGGGFD